MLRTTKNIRKTSKNSPISGEVKQKNYRFFIEECSCSNLNEHKMCLISNTSKICVTIFKIVANENHIVLLKIQKYTVVTSSNYSLHNDLTAKKTYCACCCFVLISMFNFM